MKKYQYRVFAIFFSLTIVLLQYQNCASSKGASLDGTADQTLPSGSGDLHVINEASTGNIQFIQTKTVVAASDQNLVVYGTCALGQQGGQLSWKLLNAQGGLLYKGNALCDKGAFEVRFEGVTDLACGSNLLLKAYFGAQASTETIIDKSCN
jgi:hypothetical protein